MIGKKGLDRELSILRALIDNGVPCVLTDLTNTIRYGDICVLVHDDPRFIEVKSSSTKDRRTIKQKRRLNELAKFYDEDEALGFRGMHSARRRVIPRRLVSYSNALNECIEKASKFGNGYINPEAGLHIVVLCDDTKIENILGKIDIAQPAIFSLNHAKSERQWAPLYPYTLLIEAQKALYDFIRGELYIIVLLDMKVITELITSAGYNYELNADIETPIKLFKDDPEKYILIGHLFVRCGMEVLSPKWLVETAVSGLEGFLNEME
ncbi:hypothetical protein [Fretibacter rubidus]|uniref:hypothetical protein n=1 Tax=Fretibacter rubidus TaxID=570162 RepID=UPI00352ABDCC